MRHLSAMKGVATEHGLDHILTEWGGSYLNGAGTGAGVGHAVGGTANYNYRTPAGWRGEQQDTHETAAFILQTILKSHEANLTWGAREATSYWDVSDVFEEGGFAFANNSFNGNFGLVNVHGVPKPAYRAFQLLHELGYVSWAVQFYPKWGVNSISPAHLHVRPHVGPQYVQVSRRNQEKHPPGKHDRSLS